MDGDWYGRATLALLVSCIIGSVSYVLELIQTVKYPDDHFKWLPVLTILLEDTPQVILTIMLSGAISSYQNDPSALAAFNIATSVYSAMIKVSGELFVNSCWCCSYTAALGEEGEVLNDDEDEENQH